MYNRSLLTKFCSFKRRPILTLQKFYFSTENNSKIALRRNEYHLHRFSLPTDSDSFFVDKSRLTPGESFYQKFSSGLSVLSTIGLLSFPLALFLYLNQKHKSLSNIKLTNSTSINTNNSSKNINQTVPILNTSKSLINLLDSKTPVIIFYFKSNDYHNSLLINLTKLILEEIKDIYKSSLSIVCVDVNNFKGSLTPSLKSELSTCGDFLYHLLIPSHNEPMLTTINPLITVESFIDQIIRILDPLGFKLTSTSVPNSNSSSTSLTSTSSLTTSNSTSNTISNLNSSSTNIKISSKTLLEDLDNKLSSLRNCLFELELNNCKSDTLINQRTLDSMLKECKRINI